MTMFHPLKVQSITRDTANSVILDLALSDELHKEFDFLAGQYLTFRHHHNGEELRRNYSICTKENAGNLRVGIREVEGGVFSSFANKSLQVGDVLDVMPPMGRFTLNDIKLGANVLMIAAGSGITPMISHIETLLSRDPNAKVSLIYGNRNPNSIMFRETLEDIKNTYLTRFKLVHVLSGAGQEADLFTGRIDGARVVDIAKNWLHQTDYDVALICGPEAMTLDVKKGVEGLGLAPSQIRYELFHSGSPKAKPKINQGNAQKSVDLTIVIDGTKHQLKMAKDENVLDVARESHIDAPFSCKGGICSTCRCKILEGTGEMEINHALEDYEVNAGYALSCQLRPTSETLVISYDEGH